MIRLTLLCLVCVVTGVAAQDREANPIRSLSRDTVIQLPKDLFKRYQPYGNMPNAITTKPLPPVFIGNTGKGFDLYESQVDNMGILTPDSSFVSNMPNARPPHPGFVIPLDKLDELREAQKKRDLLFRPAPPKTYRLPRK